jgi:hypothetical protein
MLPPQALCSTPAVGSCVQLQTFLQINLQPNKSWISQQRPCHSGIPSNYCCPSSCLPAETAPDDDTDTELQTAETAHQEAEEKLEDLKTEKEQLQRQARSRSKGVLGGRVLLAGVSTGCGPGLRSQVTGCLAVHS